ncbi:MAG: cupin domain-containing protein [Bacteroidota bacterium]
MIHKHIDDCPTFVAGDHTHLKEVLHPNSLDFDPGFSLAHAFLLPGDASKPHVLTHSETYYFLSGKGNIIVEGELLKVSMGSCVYVPGNTKQWVENTGTEKLVFLCIVQPAWTPSCESISEDHE